MELAARDKLIEDNIRLVGYFTGQYARKLAGKLDYDEVYSAANFGLVKAADLYEPERGTFSTFVGMCIWHRCLMDLRGKRHDALTVSLDAPVSDDPDGSLTLAEVIPDARAEFEDALAEKDRLGRFMAVLTPEERKLVLDYANGATQGALANQLKISQSYVSRKIKMIQQKEGSRVTDLEAWIKKHERTSGAIQQAAKLFGVTPAEVRRAYDRVYRLPPMPPPEPDKKNDKEDKVEKKTASTLAERAALYARLRTEGANPDEAAQAAGWKNLTSAQASLGPNGIRISAKAPYLLPDDAPRRVPKAEPVLAPVPEPAVAEAIPAPVPVPTPEPAVAETTPAPAPALIPDRMALEDKPGHRTYALAPCWLSHETRLLYIPDQYSAAITIRPLSGERPITTTPDQLAQIAEEINELKMLLENK